MFTSIAIAVILKAHVVAFVPAKCSAPRDIGGGMTVKTCEIVRSK